MHCFVLLILIVVQQSVDSNNVLKWVQKIVLHCFAVNSNSDTAECG